MSNANAQTQPYKEKGISLGTRVRCFELKSGTKQDGSMWAMFNYTEKDANKNLVQKYVFWLVNDSNFIASFPIDKNVDLEIEYIRSVKPRWNSYTKDGKQVNERVIEMEVGVKILQVMDKNNSNNKNNYNSNNNGYNNNQYNANYNNGNNNQQPNTKGATYNQQQSFDVDGYRKPIIEETKPQQEEMFDNIDISTDDLPF